jgi:Putative transposase
MSCTIWLAIRIAWLFPITAFSRSAILAVSDSHVAFRWKNYAHHNKQRTMSLTCEKFLRRFLQHLLPKGFPRIRYFGWLANRRRGKLLPLCRALLPQIAEETSATHFRQPALWRCPRCHGPMSVLERLTAAQLLETERRQECILDTS